MALLGLKTGFLLYKAALDVILGERGMKQATGR
jgi:hypothetical protein